MCSVHVERWEKEWELPNHNKFIDPDDQLLTTAIVMLDHTSELLFYERTFNEMQHMVQTQMPTSYTSYGGGQNGGAIPADQSQANGQPKDVPPYSPPTVTANGVEQQTQTDLDADPVAAVAAAAAAAAQMTGVGSPGSMTSKEQPKRLHVSNIPFRFRDPDLRQMFGVSYPF
ncbi:RNA binding protein fox-1 3 [Nymphon striatum]|nr:RNA binding protein fox-1 3 [Nymphon striatum]